MPAVRKSDENRFLRKLRGIFRNPFEDKRNPGWLEAVKQKLQSIFGTKKSETELRKAVTEMVKTEREQSAKSWQEAVTQGTNSRELYLLIKNEMKGPVGQRVAQLVAENVQYIKTVPREWAEYIEQYVYREALKGKRPEEIEKELRKVLPEHCWRNLKCIARTECGKVNAAIVEARADMCGIKAYFWRCVKDERSRDAHVRMDGIVVFYNDPPNPEALFPSKGTRAYGYYHAGNTFNCRCFQEPIVSMDMLPDSIRVHYHGQILTMGKREFKKRFGKIA